MGLCDGDYDDDDDDSLAFVNSTEAFANFPLKAFLSQIVKSFLFPSNYLVYLQSFAINKNLIKNKKMKT